MYYVPHIVQSASHYTNLIAKIYGKVVIRFTQNSNQYECKHGSGITLRNAR